MRQSGTLLWGPRNFQKYLAEIGRTADTARSISVDAYEDLAPELRDEETMVLRFGASSEARGTDFLLVRCASVRNQFYLNDAAFLQLPATQVVPMLDQAQLLPFEILPQLSEYALLSLVVASGALGRALDLDDTEIIPASGHFTADFWVRPVATQPDFIFHRQGQVEVDALFYGVRFGERVLVIVESKRGSGIRSLAKHKLVYPLLAIAPQVNAAIQILPVYVRLKMISQVPFQVEMQVMECRFPDLHTQPAVEQLEPVRLIRQIVHLQGRPNSREWRRFRPADLG